MAIEVPRELVLKHLVQSMDDRRHLQDSPILADVWLEFAKKPDEPRDLLITPHSEKYRRITSQGIIEFD